MFTGISVEMIVNFGNNGIANALQCPIRVLFNSQRP